MKRLAIAGLLVFGMGGWGQLGSSQTPPSSLISRFELINQKGGDCYFLDRPSLKRQGVKVTFSVAVVSAAQDGSAPTVIQYAANCKTLSYQALRTFIVQDGRSVQFSGIERQEKARRGTIRR